MKTTKLLGIVVVLQSLILIGQWTQGLGQPAHAQAIDPGAQRLQIRDELQTLNGKMDRLLSILESGKLQVQVAKPDER
jgi:outer membrane murein-binding lipoprotein Lpp